MNAIEKASDATEAKRKAFVRRFVEHNMKRIAKPSRSRNPMKREIDSVLADVTVNTRAGRMMIVQEANLAWQKRLLREHFDDKVFSYADLKKFIHERGWDKLWFGDGNRLRGYWLSICRRGRM